MSACPVCTILLALRGLGDHADRASENARLAANRFGEGHLISGSGLDPGLRNGSARGAVYEVNARQLQPPREFHGINEGPAARRPVLG